MLKNEAVSGRIRFQKGFFSIAGLCLFVASAGYSSPAPIPFFQLKGQDVLTHKMTLVDWSVGSPRTTVVVFLSSKCPCSMAHEEILNRLSTQYKGKGFDFVGVHSNSDESLEELKDHLKRRGLSFPVLHDPRSEWADRFGALKTPHVFVLRLGQILYEGGVDDSQFPQNAKRHYLAEVLDAVHRGIPLETTQTRTLGCRIRRP